MIHFILELIYLSNLYEQFISTGRGRSRLNIVERAKIIRVPITGLTALWEREVDEEGREGVRENYNM